MNKPEAEARELAPPEAYLHDHVLQSKGSSLDTERLDWCEAHLNHLGWIGNRAVICDHVGVADSARGFRKVIDKAMARISPIQGNAGGAHVAGAVIIYGPQGCGKTRLSKALAAYYGKTAVIDDDPSLDYSALPTNALVLVSDAATPGAIRFIDAVCAMVDQLTINLAISANRSE